MKTLLKSIAILVLIFSVSCRDTEKEEAQAKAIDEKVEALEQDIDNIEQDIEAKEQQLEDALKELDSI